MAYGILLVYVAMLFVRPQEWVPGLVGLNLLDFVAGAAILAWLATAMMGRWRLMSAPQNWLILGLLAAVSMSHIRHTYLAAFLQDFQFFGKIVLLYFLIATLVDTVPRVKGLLVVMVLGCLFMSAHGILQVHRGVGFGGHLPMVFGGLVRVRAFGFFHDPNDLALMLVAILPFLLSTALDRSKPVGFRALSAGTTIPLLYCIYLTNSRGGWLALGVMVMVFLYLWLPYKKIGIAVAVVLAICLMMVGPSRMQTMSTDDASARSRLASWGWGNRMLKQWPLFGAGMGRFAEFSEEHRVAHNSFVHCWAELGLFGYFFWLGLIVASLKDGRALSRVSGEDPDANDISRFARAGMASLIGFLTAAFFLSRTYVYPFYILIAVFACLRTVYERDFAELKSGFKRGHCKYVLVAELASIPGLYVFLQMMK